MTRSEKILLIVATLCIGISVCNYILFMMLTKEIELIVDVLGGLIR